MNDGRIIRSFKEAILLAKKKGVSHRVTPLKRETYINGGQTISPQVWGHLKKIMFNTGYSEPGGNEIIYSWHFKRHLI